MDNSRYLVDPSSSGSTSGFYSNPNNQQLATPPMEIGQAGPTLSISTTFDPASTILPDPPDLVFKSLDGVLFYVHAAHLLSLSSNRFGNLIPKRKPRSPSSKPPPATPVPLSSPTLNVLLHALYGLPSASYNPTIGTLVAAVDALPSYGCLPQTHVAPATPLFSLLLARAPLAPLAVYALAAAHDLPALAAPVSAYLLSFPLLARASSAQAEGKETLTDALAERVGALYLKRLFALHTGRVRALREMLVRPPETHAESWRCGFAAQKKVSRAWGLAAAYVAWDARPDYSVCAIENALGPLADHVECEGCKKAIRSRVREIVVQWSMVKPSISIDR
ncbi:uncharacterized protein BXZ73DRAFT_102966 [Epithele typhae]|uniref:uncharacterized protein n=1 Tax=Epithele typhae TaxID=378194 RepID=UPI0020077839|nr:uncharacterized protein BXZ73DRAFT_102966 [Epithele typhae]KAH9926284.1 hypothetical protein BXZ73DRAFT_102966 [Epithele typhae]